MNPVFYITSSFLMFLILISFFYFTKKRINNYDNHKFSIIIIFMIITLIIDIIGMVIPYEGHEFLKIVLKKLYFTTFIWVAYNFLIYNIYEFSFYTEKFKKIINYFITIVNIAILLLPINFILNDKKMVTGASGAATELFAGLILIIGVIIVYKIIVEKHKKNILPISFILFLGLAGTIQIIFPTILLTTNAAALTVIVMFFTIENPDIRLINALNVSKDEAERANNAKSDFLSSMSHEIRTPLNAIVGFSEMIETEDTLDGCKNYATDIINASHTLLDIVNGILDISKIEANKMEIVNKNYDLKSEFSTLVKLVETRIGDKPLVVNASIAPDIPSIMYGDIGKIKQITTNILTNAVKYTEEGHIDFKVRCVNKKDTSSLIISIADTGRGIKKDKINSLFTKFNRLDEDRNTTIEGTGLGLAITKSLTEMMGGKIVVQSDYGKGSIFTIYLNQKIISTTDKLETTQTVVDENIDFKGHTVLVVDDNKLNLKLIDKVLSKYNITVIQASSGPESIKIVETNKNIDLILMDDMMPNMSGPECLKELQKLERFSIPVVALTANAISGIKEKYIKLGFNEYLAKPIEKPELVRVLKMFLSVNLGKKKILLVDDNKMNLKIAEKMLESLDVEIDKVLSGSECIELVNKKKFDLIFMDYMMPEMDGIETLKKLKENKDFNTKVICLTAEAIEGSREKFLNAGFDDYVAKPIGKMEMQELVTLLFENKK